MCWIALCFSLFIGCSRDSGDPTMISVAIDPEKPFSAKIINAFVSISRKHIDDIHGLMISEISEQKDDEKGKAFWSIEPTEDSCLDIGYIVIFESIPREFLHTTS